jgi:hypothetical protein
MNEEEDPTDSPLGSIEGWNAGEYLYRDPDYVEGSHPMDTDDVTWHHHWQQPRTVEDEQPSPSQEPGK